MLCVTGSGFGADLHVDPNNQTGVSDGSALRPHPTIAQAIMQATNNDRILVARGTYQGPVRVEDKAVQLLGGFAGGSSPGYEGNVPGDFSAADPVMYTTTLEGTPMNAVVLFINGGASVVEGFTIRGGEGAREDEFRTQGGGVYVDGGSVTIRGNIIEDNNSRNPLQEGFGGGVYTRNGDTTITGNIIRSNLSGRGAGIAVSGGNVTISNNVIQGNLADGDHGGGIYAFSPNIVITGNDVLENEVGRDLGYGWGGGIIIFNPGASATLRHNRIHHNFSPGRGAGVFIDEGATALMENCVIYANESNPDSDLGGVYVDPSWDNIPSHLTMRHCTVYGHLNPGSFGTNGNGLFVQGNSTATVENCIFWGNDGQSINAENLAGLTIRYTTAEESHPGPGNLVADPLFANAAAGDFRLRSKAGRWNPATEEFVLDASSSPCIDAADPASPFGNETMPNGGRANQGAYGNTPQASRSPSPAPASSNGFMIY